jgi:hypothetical protein
MGLVLDNFVRPFLEKDSFSCFDGYSKSLKCHLVINYRLITVPAVRKDESQRTGFQRTGFQRTGDPWLFRSMSIPIHGYFDPWLFRSMSIPIHGYSDPCLFRSMSIPIHVYSDPWLSPILLFCPRDPKFYFSWKIQKTRAGK